MNPEEEQSQTNVANLAEKAFKSSKPNTVQDVMKMMSFAERRDHAIRKI